VSITATEQHSEQVACYDYEQAFVEHRWFLLNSSYSCPNGDFNIIHLILTATPEFATNLISSQISFESIFICFSLLIIFFVVRPF
jgi:hypothetical protein